MKKTRFITHIGIMIVSIISLLSGCDSDTGDTGDDPYAYLKKLDMDCYYIKHVNNDCEKVYFGNATFDEGSVVSSKSDSRVMWFKEDFENVPTLYKGDSLIYRTSDILSEEFVFERFEDFGYSIGICGLKETTSGRYSISTDPNDNNTYPEGDTDELLKLNNKSVIIDTLGGLPLRAPKDEQLEKSYITRIGSITGLKKNGKFAAEVYEGTTLNSYVFTADVIILGSMDAAKTTEYKFECETIISIAIPEDFNSGYYMINGAGLFRYVKGDSYDENTDFNIPNKKNSENTDSFEENQNNNDNNWKENGNDDSEDEQENLEIAYVQLNKKEQKTITARFNKGTDISSVYGYIVSPKGERYEFQKKENTLYILLDVKTTGEYTVELYNLKDESVSIDIS